MFGLKAKSKKLFWIKSQNTLELLWMAMGAGQKNG